MVTKNINKPGAFFVYDSFCALTKDGVGFCAFCGNTHLHKINFGNQPANGSYYKNKMFNDY